MVQCYYSESDNSLKLPTSTTTDLAKGRTTTTQQPELPQTRKQRHYKRSAVATRPPDFRSHIIIHIFFPRLQSLQIVRYPAVLLRQPVSGAASAEAEALGSGSATSSNRGRNSNTKRKGTPSSRNANRFPPPDAGEEGANNNVPDMPFQKN